MEKFKLGIQLPTEESVWKLLLRNICCGLEEVVEGRFQGTHRVDPSVYLLNS